MIYCKYMKFMTYNIYDGAVITLDTVVQVILGANPDVLALNEANGFDAGDTLKNFAERTGFPYFELGKCGDGDEYHVALLSKLPFVAVEHIKPLSRAAILALIDTPNVGSIAVVATHLSPYSEDARLSEAQQIIAALQPYDKQVVMGDLNSLAQSDSYPVDLPRRFNEGQLRKFTTDGALRFDVMQSFAEGGLVDVAVATAKNGDTTVPTPLNTDVEHSDLRLDYMLISGNLQNRLKSYGVVKNEQTAQASDHYPVCMEIG